MTDIDTIKEQVKQAITKILDEHGVNFKTVEASINVTLLPPPGFVQIEFTGLDG